MEKIILLVILGITIILGISSTKHIHPLTEETETSLSLNDSIRSLLTKWKVPSQYHNEILIEAIKPKYQANLKYLLAIGKVESNFNKYALGDSHAEYSYGYFQINLDDGERNDKISTLEMAIREEWYPYYQLKNNETIKQEMEKIKNGENSFLYNTNIQFHIANNLINIIKRRITEQGYAIRPQYVAYMWNEGAYSDLSGFTIWTISEPYLSRFNKAYIEVEEALNSLLK